MLRPDLVKNHLLKSIFPVKAYLWMVRRPSSFDFKYN